ncbi:UNVERIFIED_CONTAM: Spliceosome-associated protein A [Sesamum angustifolium]|uniref:Spliceosome-associated protein A n=1 Tax=Sesamum angustifolium TaxID=2727405 RepID=A0AAW2L4N1_9LAMI
MAVLQSFHYCKYRRDENQLYIFADDTVPRWLTAAQHIDFDTMAGADKFGNVYFVRLPQDVSDEIEEDPTGGKIKWEQGAEWGPQQSRGNSPIPCWRCGQLLAEGISDSRRWRMHYIWDCNGEFGGTASIHIT